MRIQSSGAVELDLGCRDVSTDFFYMRIILRGNRSDWSFAVEEKGVFWLLCRFVFVLHSGFEVTDYVVDVS